MKKLQISPWIISGLCFIGGITGMNWPLSWPSSSLIQPLYCTLVSTPSLLDVATCAIHTHTAFYLHQLYYNHHLHQRYLNALAIIAASSGQQRKATHEYELDDETRYQYRYAFFTQFFQEQLLKASSSSSSTTTVQENAFKVCMYDHHRNLRCSLLTHIHTHTTHKQFIHVTGTKGKGTVCELVRCGLIAHGKKVGTFTR